VTRRLEIIDGFAAMLPEAAVGRLRLAAGVASVTPDARLAPLEEEEDGEDGDGQDGWDDKEDGDERGGWDAAADLGSLDNVARMIGARNLQASGYTGWGIGVALVDTGVVPVDGLDARGKVINGARPVVRVPGEQRALPGHQRARHPHGRHHRRPAGQLSGGEEDEEDGEEAGGSAGGFEGIAPDARLINVKVGAASGATDVSQVLAAIDWVVAHRRDYGLNIRVLNLSYGTDGVHDYLLDPLTYAVEVAWRKGIVVVMVHADAARCRAGRHLPAVDLALVAMASAGGFDGATWQTISRSKPAWFVAMLLPPVAIAYWLLVRPQLRAAGRRS
jgi:serine protease AprX